MAIPTLETTRLILRPVTLDDAPIAQKLFDNWEVVKHLNSNIPWPMPENCCHDYYRDHLLPDMESGEGISWAIIEKSTNIFIGLIELIVNSDNNNRGFWIGEPYWRRGYITETIVATTDYAFDVLKMEKLHLNNAVENTGSHKVKERAGATLVSVKEASYVAGTLPQENWELTPEQWRASPMKRNAPQPSYIIR